MPHGTAQHWTITTYYSIIQCMYTYTEATVLSTRLTSCKPYVLRKCTCTKLTLLLSDWEHLLYTILLSSKAFLTLSLTYQSYHSLLGRMAVDFAIIWSTSTVLHNFCKQLQQPDFHFKISGFLAAIKLTDKSGYPDNGYPDMQTLSGSNRVGTTRDRYKRMTRGNPWAQPQGAAQIWNIVRTKVRLWAILEKWVPYSQRYLVLGLPLL